MEKLRVFEAFCGYGSQALALERLAEDFPEFSFEVVGVSDIDPYPLQAYQALHGHCPNYGDISMIDWDNVPDFDLFTYSFPCVDISGAGQQQGFAEGSGTRSSLLWECRKAILAKKPKYLLMENVKALVSKKFMPLYQTWLDWLETAGYKSKWAIMNAKDFGVAQNRERVFCWSCLIDEDIDSFEFPEPFELEKRLVDYLEEDVDEKYFLSDEALKYFQRVHDDESHGHKFIPRGGMTQPLPSEQSPEAE